MGQKCPLGIILVDYTAFFAMQGDSDLFNYGPVIRNGYVKEFHDNDKQKSLSKAVCRGSPLPLIEQ